MQILIVYICLATIAVSRWDSILSATLEKGPGTKRVCSDAILVSLTGMNSCIHPYYRLHWTERLALSMHLSQQGMLNVATSLCSNPVATKEVIRRLSSNVVASSYATTDALRHFDHPMSLIAGSPLRLRPDGIELSSIAFAEAGKSIFDGHGRVGVDSAIRVCTEFGCVVPETDKSTGGQEFIRWKRGYLGRQHQAIALFTM